MSSSRQVACNTDSRSRQLGEELRDIGMANASDAEERCNPGWATRALEAIKLVAEWDTDFTSDLVRQVFQEEPTHPNAWGPVWKKAIALGWIEEDQSRPRRKSVRPEAHASRLPVYRSLL